mmetsp:Transcript_13298/g.22890  ORF Transcript_13298/g.22890 Transcript_13298/m.22890 type:complete len:345 (+) Transcript_13298:117-1151(+)
MIGSLLCGRRQLSLAFDLFELLIECRAGGGRRGGAGVGVGGEMVVGGAKDVGTFLGEARQIGRDLGTADKRTFGGLGFVDGALLTILGVEQLDAHVFGHLFHRDLLATARTHLHTRRTRQLLAVVATKVAADLARVNVGRGQRQAFRCVVARLHVHVHVHVVVALLVAARTSSVACTGRLRHAAVGRGETCQCAQLRHRDEWRQFAHIVVVKLDLAGHRELVPVDGRVQFALTVVGRLRLQSLLFAFRLVRPAVERQAQLFALVHQRLELWLHGVVWQRCSRISVHQSTKHRMQRMLWFQKCKHRVAMFAFQQTHLKTHAVLGHKLRRQFHHIEINFREFRWQC